MSAKLQTYASEWIRAEWLQKRKKKSSTESPQLQSISRCLKHCVEMASEAISEISSKECVDLLVMSVIGTGREGGSMHALYLSFPGRECYGFWKDQIKYQPLTTDCVLVPCSWHSSFQFMSIARYLLILQMKKQNLWKVKSFAQG